MCTSLDEAGRELTRLRRLAAAAAARLGCRLLASGVAPYRAPGLAAMQALPDVLAYRSRLKAPLVPSKLIDAGVVPGPWRRLVFGHPEHEDGAVSRHAYAFCVLEQFWRHLERREIWAGASTR